MTKRAAIPPGPAMTTGAASPRAARGGRPTKAAAEELGLRILAVAADLFAAQGFAATTMEQVAASCGAGKDTLYRRYPSKAALFSALVDRLHAALIPELDAALAHRDPPPERLRRFARLLLAINLRPQLLALHRVALGEAMAFGGVRPVPVEKDPVMTRFAALIAEAQSGGFVVQGDPLFIAEQLLYATSIKPMLTAMLGDNRFAAPAEQDRYFALAWDQFWAGAGIAAGPRPSRRAGDPA